MKFRSLDNIKPLQSILENKWKWISMIIDHNRAYSLKPKLARLLFADRKSNLFFIWKGFTKFTLAKDLHNLFCYYINLFPIWKRFTNFTLVKDLHNLFWDYIKRDHIWPAWQLMSQNKVKSLKLTSKLHALSTCNLWTFFGLINWA